MNNAQDQSEPTTTKSTSQTFVTSPTSDRPIFLNSQIPHVAQKTDNDCSVACLIMAINYLFNEVNDNNALVTHKLKELDRILVELNVKNKSLWTIDIAHVCAIMNIKHEMFTINLGVQENYANELFYSKDNNFDDEKCRINEKFNRRFDLGLNIVKESLKLDRIKSELCRNTVCIVLVDASRLNGEDVKIDQEKHTAFDHKSLIDIDETYGSCCLPILFRSNQANDNSASDRGEGAGNSGGSRRTITNAEFDQMVEEALRKADNSRRQYCGHYIVLIGYDDQRRIVFYRNPSSDRNLSYTSYLSFETARKSFGTDEDFLFIYP